MRAVEARYGNLLPKDTSDVWKLTLHPFATQRPLRFVRDTTAVELRDYLLSHPVASLAAICDLDREISHAIYTLVTPSASWDAEGDTGSTLPHRLVSFEQLWHPEYQRYCEHALNHMINLPLEVMGRRTGKKYVGQTLSNRIKFLRDMGYASWAKGFSSSVRNAISHGQISFHHAAIHYIDKNTTETLAQSAFLRLFDALVTTCHSLVVGILLFLAENDSSIRQRGFHRLPLGILHLAIRSYATHRFFTIERLLESKTVDGRQQLNLACVTPFLSRIFHAMEALHISAALQDLGAAKFQRLGFSIECGRAISPAIFLNLPLVLEIREGKRPGTDMPQAIEGDMLWHEMGRLSQRLLGWRMSLKLHWEELIEQVIDNWRKSGFTVARSLYEIRDVRPMTVESLRRLEAIVVMKPGAPRDRETIRKVAHSAVSRMRNRLVRSESFGEPRWPRWWPGHVWVRLYASDRSLRGLRYPGRPAPGLLLHAEWTARLKNLHPVFVKKPDEMWRGLRLQYFGGA